MDIIDKSILSTFYITSIIKKEPIEIIKKKNHLSEEYINNRIENMIKNGLISNDKNSLTELGRTSLRVIFTGGVFDIIHPGHIHTLNAAKALGDVLVVVVATDTTTQKMKKRKPLHS